MKTILILLFPALLFSQSFKNDRAFHFKKDQTVKYKTDKIIEYFERNMEHIESINGQTIVGIPIEKEFKKKYRATFINGYLVQFDDSLNIKMPKCKMIFVNFENNTISKATNQNNDLLDYLRPSDVWDKVKKKYKEK